MTGLGPAAAVAQIEPTEKQRVGATILSQAIIVISVFCNYFLLYGLEGNRILLWIVIASILCIVVGVAYADLMYDAARFFGIGWTKPNWSADSLLRVYCTIDLIGLFFLVRASIAPDVYSPIFLTLPTVSIVLGAPAWWIRGLIVAVGIAYGATLYLAKVPIASTGPANQDAAHGVTLVLCLIVIFAEHLIVQRHQKEKPQVGAGS